MLRNWWHIFSIVAACTATSLTAEPTPVELQLAKTFSPITTGASQGTRWVTLQGRIDLPTKLEEHLLTYYIQLWSQGRQPETVGQLKTLFAEVAPENKGYPVVDESGQVVDLAVRYWVEKQLRLSYLTQHLRLSRNTALNFVIDRSLSHHDPSTDLAHIVYRIRLELEPEFGSLTPADLSVPLVANPHNLYYEVAGASALRHSALQQLDAGELPTPQLLWRRALTSVRHACLGEEAVSGMLTITEFLDTLRPQSTTCYLSADSQPRTTVVSIQRPEADAKVYPEYHELFRDNKLTVLLATQKCNDRAYECIEGSHSADSDGYAGALRDFGYQRISGGESGMTRYQRQVGDLTIEVVTLNERRPAIYEAKFWELYPQSEIVVTNRMPLYSSQQFNRIYAPRYQIVVSEAESRLAWGRILPSLDYGLENFDAVGASVETLPDTPLLDFLEKIAQTARVYTKPLSEWTTDTDWRHLLAALEAREGAEPAAKGSAVAHYVRNNVFDPTRANQQAVDFGRKPPVAAYVALLNTREETDDTVFAHIDHRLTYLYLTLYLGDEADTFAVLHGKLKALCETEITNPNVKAWYFFARDCSPRFLVTSERTNIHDIFFARGSFLDLYFGQRAVPKAAYLADTTRIGEFDFKAHFVDTDGVVKFHRTTGRVMQGHLAHHTDYNGLPLNGGKGTSMVRFYENGSLKTAQLREDVTVGIGRNSLRLRGAIRGPQQVSFFPTGELQCAYLASPHVIDGLQIAAVWMSGPDVERETMKVCFHANGQLQAGTLVNETVIGGAPYPAGTKITLNNLGEVIGPIFHVMREGEYYWDTLFPAGSLYTVNGETGNPSWMRLNGPLTLRNHTLPPGTEVVFTRTGFFEMVKAPADGRPRIVLRDYSISVPERSTLLFYRGSSEPSELRFDRPVQIGDLTFLPKEDPLDTEPALSFHGSGRIASGILGANVDYADPHYESIPLAAGRRVRFSEQSTVVAGTLAAEFVFHYKILNAYELPDEGIGATEGGLGQYLIPVTLPAGSMFSLDWQGRLHSAELSTTWTRGNLTVNGGGVVHFGDSARVWKIDFAEAGGTIDDFTIAQGSVELHTTGWPKAITLASPEVIGGVTLPAGVRVAFFPDGKIQKISARVEDNLIIDVGERKYTRELVFASSGKLIRAFLAEDIVYGGIKIASVERCQALRLASPTDNAASCAVTLYNDGISIMLGTAAESTTVSDRLIAAGQPVEFLENGALLVR